MGYRGWFSWGEETLGGKQSGRMSGRAFFIKWPLALEGEDDENDIRPPNQTPIVVNPIRTATPDLLRFVLFCADTPNLVCTAEDTSRLLIEREAVRQGPLLISHLLFRFPSYLHR